MEYIPGQIKEAIRKAPAEIQAVIRDDETEQKIVDLGKKYNLHIDQMGQLDDEVLLILTGLSPYSNFTENIIKRLRIDETTGKNITTDVNNEIFLPIRESLKRLAGQNQPSTPVAAPTPAPQDPMATLGRKYNLSPEQQANLATVMAKVKTGEYKLGVLAATLHTSLGVDFKTAEGLTSDLTAQILAAPAAPTPATAGTNIFESKMGQMFKLPKEQVDLREVKPWSTDPYMEKPE